MADNTILQQGRFTSLGTDEVLEIRSDLDWITVYNETNAGATGDDSVKFYFQRGMASATGIRYFKSGGGNNLNLTTLASPNGFTFLDSSGNPLSAAVAITATTNVVRPIVATADTAGLVAGDVVRLTGVTDAEDLSGLDFTIDTINDNVDFRIAAQLATAPGAAGIAGAYRKINFDPLYYPRHRTIVNISQATSAVITTSVRHGYLVGQSVRFLIPETLYGMVEMDGLLGTITAINDAIATQQITVDIDSSAFTAFTFPTAAQAADPLSQALVVPVGMNIERARADSVNELSDATDNRGFIGVRLPTGADAPGGALNDVMYWVAGKSFSVDNR